MPTKRHNKGHSATKITATPRSTRARSKQQSDQEQQSRESQEDAFVPARKFESHVSCEEVKKDEAYNDQSSNPLVIFADPINENAEPLPSHNTNSQRPSPTTTNHAGNSRFATEDLAPFGASSLEDHTIDSLPRGKKRFRWSKEDRDRLLQMKRDDFTWKEIQAAFPGRSLASCQNQWLTRFGNSQVRQVVLDGYTEDVRIGGLHWTPAEDEILQRLRRDDLCAWDRVLEALPGRTADAASQRYKKLTRKLKAEESAPDLIRTPKKRSATSIEDSTPVSSKKCAKVVSQDNYAAEAPLSANLNSDSTRTSQPAFKEATVAEAGDLATEYYIGRRVSPTIPWTLPELELLSQMKRAGNSWAAIVKILPNNRSFYSAQSQWKKIKKGWAKQRERWSTDEEQRLERLTVGGFEQVRRCPLSS